MELVKRISILRDIYQLLTQEKEAKHYILKSRTFGSDGAVLSARDKLELQGSIGDILD